jgi:hypothetical protein
MASPECREPGFSEVGQEFIGNSSPLSRVMAEKGRGPSLDEAPTRWACRPIVEFLPAPSSRPNSPKCGEVKFSELPEFGFSEVARVLR